MSIAKMPSDPLPPEVQDLLLAGIVASIAQQGKLTREMPAQLPGIAGGPRSLPASWPRRTEEFFPGHCLQQHRQQHR